MPEPRTCTVCGLPWHQGKEPCVIAQQRVINDARARLAEAEALLRKVLHHQPPAPNPPARYLIEIAAFLAAGDPDA